MRMASSFRKVTTGEIASTASIQAIIPMVRSRNRASEYRKFKRPFPPPAAPLPPARPRAVPTARRGWEYSLDAMSAAGRGQAQPGRDERCWNASLDAMRIAGRDAAYHWDGSHLALT